MGDDLGGGFLPYQGQHWEYLEGNGCTKYAVPNGCEKGDGSGQPLMANMGCGLDLEENDG